MTKTTISTNVMNRTSLSFADCERVKRGQVYIADLGQGCGSEQQGIRPVLIVQNDKGNYYSNTVLVVPITSAHKKSIPTHVSLMKGTGGLTKDSTLVVEQMRTVDKSRLRNCIGALPTEIMNVVNEKILVQVGIC